MNGSCDRSKSDKIGILLFWMVLFSVLFGSVFHCLFFSVGACEAPPIDQEYELQCGRMAHGGEPPFRTCCSLGRKVSSSESLWVVRLQHTNELSMRSVGLHVWTPAQNAGNSFFSSILLSLLHLNPSDTIDPLSGGLLLGNTKCIVRVTH